MIRFICKTSIHEFLIANGFEGFLCDFFVYEYLNNDRAFYLFHDNCGGMEFNAVLNGFVNADLDFNDFLSFCQANNLSINC